MATLQNIRSKGPLLIIVVGLALFAFIAGDAWKVLQPNQPQDVGEVNGEALSVQEFQQMLEEYTEVIKFSNRLNSLTDEQTNQIKDEVWNTYVNNTLIKNEAEKLGLTVPDSEIESIIDAGVHPLLRSTPFFNQQTGRFDKDQLKMFLVEVSKLNREITPSDVYEQYMAMDKFWSFIETTLKQTRLNEKYQSLIGKSIMSNSIEAQNAFNARNSQADLVLAGIPYSAIADSTVSVKVSEVKEIYNKRKEQFKLDNETRNIRYIDVQVTASKEDTDELMAEVTDYATQLETATADEYAGIVRDAASEIPYVDLFSTRRAFPADLAARLDSAAVGETYGPYFNATDNTFNAFKKIARVMAPDSIEFRQIQVYDADPIKTKTLADSIYTALRGGARFTDLAAKYNQEGQSVWISSADYENSRLDGNNLKLISTVTSLKVNEVANLEFGDFSLILQVTSHKNQVEKFKVAAIKRTNDFSKETYNKAYNDFSQFVAANATLDKVIENAEEAGYRLLERRELRNAEHGIGNIRGTKDALRWAFAAKPGEVSGLYEAGENDRLLVVALEGVNKAGYRSFESVSQQLRAEVVKDKKAQKIMSDIKAAGATSLAQVKAMTDAVSDTVKHVTFSAPAYVPALRSSEPLVSAYGSVAQTNQVSAPIKGNNGVYVLDVYAKENLEGSFVAEDEKTSLKNTHERMASRFISDLYQKANVKDNRYLFF